jgi:hypothetical protein
MRRLWYGSVMSIWRLTSLSFLLFSCGGSTDNSLPQAFGGQTSIAGLGGNGGQGASSSSGGNHTGGQAYSTYTAIGCPDAGPPAVIVECELFSSTSGCPAGQACYPTTKATSNPCQPEQYYYLCALAGTGTQGDDCNSSNDCAQGFVCVVTGTGTECEEMCGSSGTAGCSGGRICEPIDVAGVGTCS